MAQEVFKRYEKKYRMTEAQYKQLLPGLLEKVRPDEYGTYTICNIYFDTPDYELIRTSLEKPIYKEKLRLRSYGVPGPEDMVFIELKKKFEGIVYKRRTQMSLREAESYLYQGIKPRKNNQIMKELDWFTNRYELKPAVYLAYDRKAFAGKEDDQFRITFDRNIRYRTGSMDLQAGSAGKRLIPEDMILMEIKIADSMPLWLSQLLSERNIFPCSFSKYGRYYQENMQVLLEGVRKYA